MTETLTDEERRWLESDPEFQKWDVRRKVLRIIDAHAADRAALVAQLEAAERDSLSLHLRIDDLCAQLAELTRERDEARAKAARAQVLADSRFVEVTRLTEALHDRATCPDCGEVFTTEPFAELRAEVARLTKELAAADRAAIETIRDMRTAQRSLESAAREMIRVVQTDPLDVDDVEAAAEALGLAIGGEAKPRQDEAGGLKAELASAEDRLRHECSVSNAAEARVRELEQGRADFIIATMAEAHRAVTERVEALETLLAASEARAAQWQEDARRYQGDAIVAQDRLAALKARIAHAVAALTRPELAEAHGEESAIADALEALRG